MNGAPFPIRDMMIDRKLDLLDEADRTNYNIHANSHLTLIITGQAGTNTMADLLCAAALRYKGSTSLHLDSPVNIICFGHDIICASSAGTQPKARRHGSMLRWVSPGWCHFAADACFPASSGQRRFPSGKGSKFDIRYQAAASTAPAARKEVQVPPPDFDFRAETREDTLAVVSSSYPALMDLVEDGTLLVVKPSAGYVERRQDGYREPEIVFVVGTAHMSLVSAMQVERVVKAVRPESVVVELCRSRAGIMFDDSANDPAVAQQKTQNFMSLSGENFGSAISRTLKLGGRSALALRLLLGSMSQKISNTAGVTTGAEFRAARKAAQEVGSQLVLGDRPIEVTLQRAWEALKWDERLRLATIFLQAMTSSDLDTSEEALQARSLLLRSPRYPLCQSTLEAQVLKSDDALSAMFTEIGVRLPSLLPPLVYERDMYLAWSLKRSKAVNRCTRVVGVVGRGHMRGLVYNLKHNQENLRFRDLVGTRETEDKRSKSEKLVTNIVIEAAVGGILWLVWELTFGKGP